MNTMLSIEKLKQGEKVEFDTFYSRFYPLFLSFALKYLSDREVCRDVVQDVFLSYWKIHTRFDDIISIKVFFYRSIRNECINQLNRTKVHDKFVDRQRYEMTDDHFFFDNIIREEVAFAVHQQIKTLSPMGQAILMMAVEGKSNEEIATELAISINTVKTHKARSYQILRQRLQDIRSLLFLLGGI